MSWTATLIVVDEPGDNVVGFGETVMAVASVPEELELIDKDALPMLLECK